MLIDYVYIVEIQVIEENVQVFFLVVGFLQLQDVKKICCEFLEFQFYFVNCLGIWVFVDMYVCIDFLNKVNIYVE